ncbi:MAG: hypothetical protein DRJ51_06675 [Thermoprotei archaeon]|nr:MAG: hypothetical protein DRJ51_06675 [Thermoprotei archaeon]RLF00756.1 MAG: hypothetical protein DRJ59_06945 [Thermoprotei archaeon]
MAAKLVVVGFGSVGRSLVRIILERGYLDRLKIVSVIDSKGAVVSKEGLSESVIRLLIERPRGAVSSIDRWGYPGLNLKGVLDLVEADIIVELTPSNYRSGEPGITHLELALSRGIDVVTANKAPIALRGLDLIEEFAKRSLKILYRATVMGGTPLIPTLASIRHSVREVRGILNATTNFILTSMLEERISFKEALDKAIKEGVAEADPSLDVDGWDVAAKLTVIVVTLGRKLKLSSVERVSLRTVSLEEVLNEAEKGRVIKYLAELNLSEGIVARVKPAPVDRSSALARVRGFRNGVIIRTPENEIYLEGLGGGGRATAEAVLEDILALMELRVRG